MLFCQQGVEHVKLALLWVPFRVPGHPGGDGAAGKVRDVLQQRKAPAVGPGSIRGVSTDGEHFRDAGVPAVAQYGRKLPTAFDAPGGQVRDDLVAKPRKLNRRFHGAAGAMVRQARYCDG
jgi:hypothetical protein